MEWLDKMVQQKQMRAKQRQAEDLKVQRRMQAEATRYAQEQQEQARKRRLRELQYRDALDRQLAEKSKAATRLNEDDDVLLMNKHMLAEMQGQLNVNHLMQQLPEHTARHIRLPEHQRKQRESATKAGSSNQSPGGQSGIAVSPIKTRGRRW